MGLVRRDHTIWIRMSVDERVFRRSFRNRSTDDVLADADNVPTYGDSRSNCDTDFGPCCFAMLVTKSNLWNYAEFRFRM